MAPTHRKRSRLVLASLLIVALGVVGGELLARLVWPPAARPRVWAPRTNVTFEPDPAHVPGVSGPSSFRTSSVGLRGDEPPAQSAEEASEGAVLRIVAVGGSTTECLYLDQDEAWPALLQARLAADLGERVWVGNAGRSGHTTREHLLQVEELVRLEPRPGLLLLMAGCNDLTQRLARGEAYDPRAMDDPAVRADVRREAFAVLPAGDPGESRPWLKRTALWGLASRLRSTLFPDPRSQRRDGSHYAAWRALRAGASERLGELPDLGPALGEFRANLAACIATARAAGVELVLIDQPALWRADLEPELGRLLWLGGVGEYTSNESSPYYSVAALARGIERYNAELHALAAEEGIQSIALAGALPRDGSVFYDDVHFNEEGARRVAAVVAEALEAGPALARARR